MATTIPLPDALASALRTHYLSAPPAGALTESARVRLRDTPGEPPLPRIEILPGEPRRVPQMDGTARVPIEIVLVTSKDAPEASHLAAAAALDGWTRGLASPVRPGPLPDLYLHAWLTMQPTSGFREEARERVTACRAEAVVTLCQTP
jgi:hypothetical protein